MSETDPVLPPDPAVPPPATPAVPLAAPVGSTGVESLAYVGPEPDKDSKTMAMLCHLLAIFTGFIGPLVIWLVKKDQSPFVDDQGKEALNFQLTVLIGYVVGMITSCLGVGLIITPVVWIVSLIFCIMATMKANTGVAYRYPINIRFIK